MAVLREVEASAAPGPTSRAPSLTFQRTLDRAVVHREACSEVYLTDHVQQDETTHYFAAQLPRRHFYYGDGHALDLYDPLLLQEVIRQAGISTVLRDDTGGADRFVLDRLSTTIASLPALHIDRSPAQVRMLMTARRNGRNYQGIISGEINDGPVFEATLAGRILTPAAYQRIRAGTQDGDQNAGHAGHPRASEAATVGRGSQSNVVIGDLEETGGGVFVAALLVDDSHPAIFDQALDHLPGSLLLEGVRQTFLKAALQRFAMAPSHGVMTRWSAVFANFGELDRPTDIQISLFPPAVSRPGPPAITGTGQVTQGAHLLAGVSVTVSYLEEEKNG